MENKVMKSMRKALVRSFLDIIVLNNIKDHGPLSGYDIIELVQTRFNFMVSPGSVYSLLYSLEREGLVISDLGGGKRMFNLTEKGKEYIGAILNSNEEILKFARCIFENQ
jgi:DNA-binding PadR family transcriptional regulator